MGSICMVRRARNERDLPDRPGYTGSVDLSIEIDREDDG
jgi:hypothetical protein